MKKIILLVSIWILPTYLFAINYHIGNGQTYLTIASVPWSSLLPGDIVYIHANPLPYKEKIVLSQSGTSLNPIKIIGIPDQYGNKPIIDGDNATSQSSNYLGAGQSYSLNTRGLITIAPRPGYTWGYKPSYISIEGIEIKNANPTKAFYEDGISMNYIEFCAGIYADRCENIKIKNCTIHDCALGIFINSKGDEATQSRHIIIEGNHIYHAGVAGSYLEHSSYIEAIDVIYQYNKYGPLINGALGGALKDRSAGTIIRYNEISAGQRILDLVNAQNSAAFATTDSMYKKSYVYGNLLINPVNGSGSLIHYGGDDYGYQNYRRGTLYYYNNTLINTADQSDRYRTIIFDLPSDAETFDGSTNFTVEEKVICYNNIFYNEPRTLGSTPTELIVFATDSAATIELHKNWFSPNVTQHYNFNGFSDTCIGWANAFHSTTNNPGFQNTVLGNYQLSPQGECVNSGENLPQDFLILNKQYLQVDSCMARIQQGLAMDIGYFEAVNNFPLPTTNIQLNAFQTENNIEINCYISSTAPMAEISFEHSFDGIHFYEIKNFINKKNNTNFSFLHNAPVSTWNYYRAKTTDLNEQFTYSTIEPVFFKDVHQNSMHIFPNPTNKDLFIIIDKFNMNNASIILTTIFGRPIQIKPCEVDSKTYKLDVSNIPNGIYVITVSNNEGANNYFTFVKK